MSLLHHAQHLIGHAVRGLLAKKQMDTACVTANFDVSEAPEDPNVQADYPAAAPRTKDYRAFVHYVSLRNSVRQWMSIQVGDVILGMLPEDAAEVAGKNGVTFTLPDGKKYQQSDAGGELRAFWDVHIGGEAGFVQFLLRPVP